MTNPALRDPEKNVEYYRFNTGYEDNKARFEEPRVKWVAQRLPKRGRVLDVGCNDAFVSELLAPDVQYLGVELNAKAIENAYPRARGRIIQADAATMVLPPEARDFDAVLCLEMLEHAPDPVGLLVKLRGLLRPSGVLITTSALGHGSHWEPGNSEHLVEWTPPQYFRLHVDAGFIVLEQATARVYGERFTNAILATPGVGASA